VNDLSTVEARPRDSPTRRCGQDTFQTSFDSDSETDVCAGAMGHFMGYADDLSDAWNEEEDIAVFSVEALTGLAAALNLEEAAFVTRVNDRTDSGRQARSPGVLELICRCTAQS
jgi:hypothetical protein